MKVITYRPHSAEQSGFTAEETFPVEALAETMLKHQSLWGTIEELQREGYRNENSENNFPGIAALLEDVKQLKKRIAAARSSDMQEQHADTRQCADAILESLPSQQGKGGYPLIEQSLDKRTLRAFARLLSDAGKLKLTHQAMRALGALFYRLEDFEKSLKRVYWGFDLESIDQNMVEALLGEARLRDWQNIKNLSSQMVREGYAEKGPSGLKLTSRGLQKIAWYMLREISKPHKINLRSAWRTASVCGEPHFPHDTRPYHFGDPLMLDTSQTVFSAVRRNGAQVPAHIKHDDFIVHDRDPVSRSATVLLIDLSKSMRFEGRYIAAKKVTLALYEFIRRRYPKDRVAVIGFSTEARTIARDEIPFLVWDEMNPYTNMEAALYLAQKALALHKGYRRQIFLITDGEPTAHREQGFVFFQFPPHHKTLQKTVHAARSLIRQKIDLSIFLLAQETSNIQFADEMAKRTQGRIFHISPKNLGQCVLMDYVDRKKKWI